MSLYRKQSWPDLKTQHELNRIIRESSRNPFGVSAYNPNEPIMDFVGRKEELEIFKEQIRIVVQHGISRAVRLEGPAGVGKSTLFNYLKEEIQRERVNENRISQYITEKNDIFSTYFNIPDKISSFEDIWIPMFEGLRSNFEPEIGYDIQFPEYLVLTIVHKLLQEYPDEIAKIIWVDREPPYNFQEATLRNIYDPLVDGAPKTVKLLQEFWQEKKRMIRNKYFLKEGSITYRLSRDDNDKIHNLFRVLDEDDDFLDEIVNAKSGLFGTSEELISYFNDLMRYYTCFTKKIPIVLIGIDEAAKGPSQMKEEYYQNLANLFVKLRNSLNNILFVFISTTEDWAEYDKVIKKYTDLQNQVSEFMHKISLKQLKVEEVIEVFKRRMERFWRDFRSYNQLYLMYPFSEQAFEYFYRYNNRDLRKTILFLKELWVKLKILEDFPKLETSFDCMRYMEQYGNHPIDPKLLRDFEWKIIEHSFLERTEFKNNARRSSAIEKGIENAWRTLMMDKKYDITDVENNKVFYVNGVKRRPDVYVEILGNLGAEYRRRIEFQVKAYHDNSRVELKDIESSLELFKSGHTDFLYFIITGAGFDADAEQAVLELEETYPDRIRRPPLNHEQKKHLYFLALYKEITGIDLYNDPQRTKNTVEYCLGVILGTNVINFISQVKQLGYRAKKGVLEAEIQEAPFSVPPKEIKKEKHLPISLPKQKPLTREPVITIKQPVGKQAKLAINVKKEDIASKGEEKKEKAMKEKKRPAWCEEYKDLENFFPELCGLCRYMRSRESGRYAWKFTQSTVINNVIERDAILEKGKFRNLIKIMESKGFLKKVKSSYQFTETGKDLYYKIKKANYEF